MIMVITHGKDWSMICRYPTDYRISGKYGFLARVVGYPIASLLPQLAIQELSSLATIVVAAELSNMVPYASVS